MQDPQTITATGLDRSAEDDVDVVAFFTSDFMLITYLTLIAYLIRIITIGGINFPIGDGGMIYQMTGAIVEADFRLPETVTFNGHELPFIYPPVALYIAAFISEWFSVDLLTVFYTYPFALSILSVPLVYLLYRTVIGSKKLSFTGALLLTLLPSSIIWLVLGTGVTRATGFVFAVLGLQFSYLLISQRNENYLPPAAVLIALAFLSEPEMGYFASYSVLLMLLFFGRSRFSVLNVLLVAVIVIALVGLWWFPIILVAGIMPFLQSSAMVYFPLNPFYYFIQTGIPFTGEMLIPVVSLLAVFGFFVLLAKRRFFLPGWFMAIFLLHPRSAPLLATIPMAMMAAVAVHQLIEPLMSKACKANYGDGLPPLRFSEREWVREWNQHLHRVPVILALSLLLFYAIYVAYVSTSVLRGQVLDPLEKAAMERIANSDEVDVLPDGQFLVITDAEGWKADAVATWFPIFAQRESLIAVQNSSWYSNFRRNISFYEHLQTCSARDVACILDLDTQIAIANGIEPEVITPQLSQSDIIQLRINPNAATTTITKQAQIVDYIYISRAARGAVTRYLEDSDEFTLINSTDGILVFEREGIWENNATE